MTTSLFIELNHKAFNNKYFLKAMSSYYGGEIRALCDYLSEMIYEQEERERKAHKINRELKWLSTY